jgi:ABC-type oligopeptide transport system ATPase subunit
MAISLFSELRNEYGVGSIFIVTNASMNWVQDCLKHVFQKLRAYIEEQNIKIYSARKRIYSKNLPKDYWKVRKF